MTTARAALALGFGLVASACADGGSSRTCEGQTAAALTDNPAGLDVIEHAPGGAARAGAIVVALHGCTQTAEAYQGAGWNELADKLGFAVIYPGQTTANNAERCFRWWDPSQAARDQGEARSIAQMALAAKDKYGASHVFVTGLSAGAAMAVALLAVYPDVFEAGAIMSGIPYGCATSVNDTFTCMNGRDRTADEWAAALPAAARAKPPRISIWQGTADYLVRPTNADQLVRQWTKAHGAAATPSSTEKVGPATHETFGDGVERWTIDGMSHGVALSPSEGCGTAGAFLLDVKLCSTSKAAEFFGLAGGGAGAAPQGTASSSGGDDGASHNGDCTN